MNRIGLCAVVTAVLASAIVGSAALSGLPRAARADDLGKGGDPTAALPRDEFLRRGRTALKELDGRLCVLARRLTDDPDSPAKLKGQILDMRLAEKRAEAEYLNATLAREVAEIALKEYTLGTYVQDLAVAEGELSLARNDVDRAERGLLEAKERLARITALTDNSALGLNLDYLYTDRLSMAELQALKAKLVVEQAEGKKKILVDYIKPKRVAELRSDVMKAKSDEFAKQATWGLAKGKIDKAQTVINAPWPTSPAGKRLAELLNRAIPIEELAHARLEALRNSEKIDDAAQKEIRELTNQLRAIIEEAEAANAESDFARLKSWLRVATRAS